MDYRKSHLEVNKGITYDKSFIYSDYRQFVYSWEKEILSKIISSNKISKENYLDFACGTGRIAKHLESSFKHSYGIDVSESMIEQAKDKLSSTKLVIKDITKQNPFQENQMDFITSFRFFLNAENELKNDVLKTLYTILKPSGLLVINIHNNRTIITKTLNFATILKKKIFGENFIPQKSCSIRTMKKLLEENQFEIEKTYHKVVIPIKSENTKFKISRLHHLESTFSSFYLSRYLSRNIIYVCKKKI